MNQAASECGKLFNSRKGKTKCFERRMTAIFEGINYPYMDLIYYFTSSLSSLVVKVDKGEISNTEARGIATLEFKKYN